MLEFIIRNLEFGITSVIKVLIKRKELNDKLILFTKQEKYMNTTLASITSRIKFSATKINILFLSMLFIFVPLLNVDAQVIGDQNKQFVKSLAFKDTVKTKTQDSSADSLSFDGITESKPKLLPDKMSFMEKGLWGEHGLVRSIGIASPLTSEVREHELGVRRFMLTAHQIGGFTTLGLMLGAVYYGQRVIDGHRNLGDTHQALVSATIFSYALTGLLAILSPPPLIRRDEESTTTLHKTLAWIHVAGMIITPILGSMIGGRRNFNIDKAHYHQIAGYITTAVFATSMIVVTF